MQENTLTQSGNGKWSAEHTLEAIKNGSRSAALKLRHQSARLIHDYPVQSALTGLGVGVVLGLLFSRVRK